MLTRQQAVQPLGQVAFWRLVLLDQRPRLPLSAPLLVKVFLAGSLHPTVTLKRRVWNKNCGTLLMSFVPTVIFNHLGAGILHHFVKSTTAGTVSAVAVEYFDRLFKG